MPRRRKTTAYPDLVITFKHVCLDCTVDEEDYTEEEFDKLKTLVKGLSREICLDRSYVTCAGNKHRDTYIKEQGWKELCKTIIDSKYGQMFDREEREMFNEACRVLIVGYMYSVLEKYGYDGHTIMLSFEENTRFTAEYEIDTYHEWKSYPGPWQDWDFDRKPQA